MDEGGMLRKQARAIWREPLVHFLIGGLAIFLFSMWRGSVVDPASRTIDITEEQVASLSAGWEQMWRRPPDAAELDALIRDYIKEEIYYREARRLGLDEDDAVIRRRLRSKMEFLTRAEVESVRADDAILQAWLQKHQSRFASEAVYSFDQIYVGSRDVSNMLRAISKGANWRSLGEAIDLPKSVDQASRSAVERQFGPEFAASLATLAPGKWAGPVASGFGQHLVHLRDVQVAAKPQLADVRQAVENDWRSATYTAREAKTYQTLLDGYTIRIEKP
jgi:peptidyl-prolyl cis-trans isomerase C